MIQPHWKIVFQFLSRLTYIDVPNDLSSLLFGICPWKLKICPCKNLYANIHNGITYNSYYLKYPLSWWMGEQNVLYLCNGISSALKRREALICVKTWVNLENMVRERSPTQKTTYMIWFILSEMSRIGKSIGRKRISCCQRLGREGIGSNYS